MRLAWLVLLLGVTAQAAVESEQVQQGVASLAAAEFEKCVEVLGRALEESLTREEKIVTYRTLGFCHSGLGHTDAARDAFVQLLRVDDKAELDKSAAPKVRALFEEARAAIATGQVAAPTQEPVLPSLHPEMRPSRGTPGQPLQVIVSYPGGSAQTVQIFHRGRGQAHYSTLSATVGPDGKFVLTVPGSEVQAPAVELYVTALDAGGGAVARAGSFSEPLTVAVTAPPEKPRVPVYKRGWLWGVIGVAAAGLAVGLGVGLTVGRTDPNGPAQLTIIAPGK
jgi:hypothetical protein